MRNTPQVSPGDKTIPADLINAKITLADLMAIVHAGPGVSIKRAGGHIVISALRQGTGGGGSTLRDSHHVVEDFDDLDDITTDAVGDIAVLTTPRLMAYRVEMPEYSEEWVRLVPMIFAAADPSTAPPSNSDGHFWLNTTDGKLWQSLNDEWLPLSHIDDKVS